MVFRALPPLVEKRNKTRGKRENLRDLARKEQNKAEEAREIPLIPLCHEKEYFSSNVCSLFHFHCLLQIFWERGCSKVHGILQEFFW